MLSAVLKEVHIHLYLWLFDMLAQQHVVVMHQCCQCVFSQYSKPNHTLHCNEVLLSHILLQVCKRKMESY